MSLSADRAYSVMAYLQSKGVPAERLSFKGYGPTKPLTSNSSEEGRAMNRRTEFKIISF
jgi:outer membrane protein OmpA-like peptidoglycan-associated protein